MSGGSSLFGSGGDSSKDTTQTTATTTNTTSIDKRQVVDGQGVGVSSDQSTVNVSLLDENAVNHAIDLTNTVGAGAVDAYKALLAATVALAGNGLTAVNANTDLAKQLATPEVQSAQASQTVKYGAIAAVVVVGYMMMKGHK